MKILIACEFTGIVRDAFRAKGHDAWSCDLRPDVVGSPFHLQGDVFLALGFGNAFHFKQLHALTSGAPILFRDTVRWDTMIAHPPCTYLTNSAEWAYGPGPYHQKVKPETLTGEARKIARNQAIDFFKRLWNADVERIAMENPPGVIGTRLCKSTQSIQPYDFYEDASKRTCLWLKNLEPLRGTKRFPPRLVTPWIPCPEGCGEYWCNLHRKHASECACKPIDELEKGSIFPVHRAVGKPDRQRTESPFPD